MSSRSPLVHAAGCTRLPCPNGERVVAFSWGDLNPLTWLGEGASYVATSAWKGAMTSLWSAGLWLLDLAFKIIDAFTTPDLSATGPLAQVLPYTFALGAMIAALMAFVQIGAALYRRDGASIARVMVGVVQFGAVWIGYLVIAATLVTATAGLTTGLLQGLLHVDAFSGFSNSASWPRNVSDAVVATVLGLCTIFLIFPAAIGYVLLMLVREATLMLLTVTSPIAAGGLLSEGTRAWFWKSLRWFLATLMIAPLAALVLGVGVKITQGVLVGHGDKTAASVGMAVTGCILILIGAVCPLILFRLLAFVDPGTSTGATMRQAFASSGGMTGLLGGKSSGGSAGSGAATKQDSNGRSQGESSADSTTQSRFGSMTGSAGQMLGMGGSALSNLASKSAAVGSDVLGSAGVGNQAPYFGQADNNSSNASRGSSRSGGGESVPGGASGDTGGPGPDSQGSGGSGGGAGGNGGPPAPPMPTTGTPGGGSAGVGLGGASGAGGAGAVAEVPIVPV